MGVQHFLLFCGGILAAMPGDLTSAQVVVPTPQPTAAPAITSSCGVESSAALQWQATDRKLRIDDGGCMDMTRIYTYLTMNNITDVITKVSDYVWMFEGTLNVKVDTTLKLIGSGDAGDCDELRLVANARPSRVLGNGGSVYIKNTKIYGWRNGALDTVADSMRGYVLCRSCHNNSPYRCTMTVADSTIGYLGFGTVSYGGLSWKDLCETPSSASAQNVTIMENYRGVYTRGVDVIFDNVAVSGGVQENIRIDRSGGHLISCSATPAESKYGVVVRRSPGIQIRDNTLIGERGMFLTETDGLEVTGNVFQGSRRAVRVRTTTTTYSGNTGDGMYSNSSTSIGLVANKGGCFHNMTSSSADPVVAAYLIKHACPDV